MLGSAKNSLQLCLRSSYPDQWGSVGQWPGCKTPNFLFGTEQTAGAGDAKCA